MANPLFCSSPLDFGGVQCIHGPSEDYSEDGFIRKGNHEGGFLSVEELGQNYQLCSESGADQHNFTTQGLQDFLEEHEKQLLQLRHDLQQPQSSNVLLDEYFASCFRMPAQQLQDVEKLANVSRPSKVLPHPSDVTSLELLNHHKSKFEKLKPKHLGNSETSTRNRKRLSTEEIIRVAGARYIQLSDQNDRDISTTVHPYGHDLGGLCEEETRDVELAHLLLTAAEKVGQEQFDSASKLLSQCEQRVYERVTPFQRVIFCFAEAQRKRIDKATGRFSTKVLKVNPSYEILQGLSIDVSFLISGQKIPLNQAMQLTAIQAIIENMGSMRKLHLIDLEIRSGVQWTALMQALAERSYRPIKHLKITSVCRSMDREKIDGIGKSLECFAESLNLPFTFDAVYISSFTDLKREQFETEADESVVIFSNKILRTMISTPDCLEHLMSVIRNITPSLMVVQEIEANHNSPVFVDRFVEALFFFGAYFDCLGTCMDKNTEHREKIEAIFCHGIQEIVALEGKERTTRSVKLQVWRAYFSRFKMVEVGFSELAQRQATLVFDQSPFGSLCTFDKDDQSLLVGWRGMPLFSLSAWKFSREIFGKTLLR